MTREEEWEAVWRFVGADDSFLKLGRECPLHPSLPRIMKTKGDVPMHDGPSSLYQVLRSVKPDVEVYVWRTIVADANPVEEQHYPTLEKGWCLCWMEDGAGWIHKEKLVEQETTA